MKRLNLIIKSTLILALVTNSLGLSVYADFSDVPASHENYEAINALQKVGILQGYSDGTFLPEKAVNRAEFLKIVLEGSQISLDNYEQAPFSDVDDSAWYAPYLRKAYSQEWVKGYDDHTFRPEQTITKAEALKIVAEAQNWELPKAVEEKPFTDTPRSSWFTKYVEYAKSNELIPTETSKFLPNEAMTRGSISELIFNTIPNLDEITVTESEPQQDTPDNTEEQNKNPVSYSTISAGTYDNITLDDSIPNTYYKNEIYNFEGEYTGDENIEKITILIDPANNTDDDFILFRGKLTNNHFSIPVYFDQSGNYNFGIIDGESGRTRTKEISVMTQLPVATNTENAATANDINIKYSSDSTYVSFNNTTNTLKKLTFLQDGKKVSYISRQNKSIIPLRYKDFSGFKAGTVNYYMETSTLDSAFPLKINSEPAVSRTKSFSATEHTSSINDTSKITTSPIDLQTSPGKIHFSGTVKVNTQLTAYITKPDGLVDETTLSTGTETIKYNNKTLIPDGGDFQFSYTTTESGRYLLEINDKNGFASLNHALYVGGIIPLLPDYSDSHEREFFSENYNTGELRSELLNEINKSRRAHGLDNIRLDSEINIFAQAHSDDMAENNFFSHVTLDGTTPEDRGIAAGFSTPVSENIAKDVSIRYAHEGLMKSGAHRSNILDPNWTRVGLGISLDSEGYLVITEEFSTDQVVDQDLQEYENELFDSINNLRQEYNIASLNNDNTLASASEYINVASIQGQNLDNVLFEEAIDQYNISGTSQAIGRSYNIWSYILDSIITEEGTSILIDSKWRKVGIDVQVDDLGILHSLLILNTQ